ncbi:hypothetical protein ACKWO8_22855, partial [Escherichia coli]|uniref:hypothetical protein n=1 Tax=Escherichia coli TaxID=562 RepID=UPI003904B690
MSQSGFKLLLAFKESSTPFNASDEKPFREISSGKLIISADFTLDFSRHACSSKEAKEGANKRGNSSRLTQSFHFFMFEPIFSPVNALNQPI